MTLERTSPCKINFLLNVLGQREDGFHELETVMHPVPVFDTLEFERSASSGVALTCSQPELPVDSTNLVHRAATAFLHAAKISDGLRIHIEKRIPLAAGLGGGSSNAAHTLLGLNELFGRPLASDRLMPLAATLGSDVPFFLQAGPALATGRGERISALGPLPALRDVFALLVYPGFGIPTAWAYQQLARFPEAAAGKPGRAQALIDRLQTSDLSSAAPAFYNALEAPALKKYPLLQLFQEFLREHGAVATLMSGSGSTTFALVFGQQNAGELADRFRAKFGETHWLATAQLN
ncbi:MAG: 4-(cytidine 5'-diphospho)-2-C-methyl-D-erythritol kinase [Verrucomicrobia bacterium]|nr:4-(cytidine 5'-diphospho)-2-C-methyl-D-erythritol kinase [Verrucomicrobiota bacterium]